ncbi:hypothetical protein LCGC14_1107260 [marine sediment metagenome]|uniref:HNH nuclease domain-containing protein n=1 Tax=marine sediment metagenome TaxID=412755 RepID=A0A0F9MCH2_9ZZZZ
MPKGIYKRKPFTEEHKKRIGRSQTGENNHNWKGGRCKADGYILIKKPGHHRANNNNYVREHILVAEEMLGRYLEPGEIVHHINGIKDDNRPENLYIYENLSEHKNGHITLEKLVKYLLDDNIIKFEDGKYEKV